MRYKIETMRSKGEEMLKEHVPSIDFMGATKA